MDVNDPLRTSNLNIILGVQLCFSCWRLNSNLIWICAPSQLQCHLDAYYLPQTTRGHLTLLCHRAEFSSILELGEVEADEASVQNQVQVRKANL
jgi:hypothetical protein